MTKGDKVQMNRNHGFGLKNAVVVSDSRNNNVFIEHDMWKTSFVPGNRQGCNDWPTVRKLVRYTDMFEVDHLDVINE